MYIVLVFKIVVIKMMEINTKNFGMLTLLAVLMIGVVFISGCTQKQGTSDSNSGGTVGEAGGLPIYPGSQESTQYSTWATMIGFSNQYAEVHQYVVSGVSPSDVINWYKSQFPDYSVENEGSASAQGVNYAMLTLKKGNEIVGVISFEQDGQTVYFVGKVISSEEEGTSLPNHDMASGEEPIDRYPGSLMLSYSKEGKFPIYYDIEYGTNDAYDKVGDWFKSALQSQGWTVTSQSGSTDTIELEFAKDDDEVTIYVGAPGAGTAYTTIDVSYTKRSLPYHDLVTGTDPMERYPGAVMIDYSTSTMNMQGVSGSEVKAVYLTPDNFDTVKQWYLDKLNAMFGSGQGYSGVNDYGESIEAGGIYNNKLIEVTVEFIRGKKYTQVSVDHVTTETG